MNRKLEAMEKTFGRKLTNPEKPRLKAYSDFFKFECIVNLKEKGEVVPAHKFRDIISVLLWREIITFP